MSPANGLTQVPTNARVTIQFNEPVDARTLSQVTLSGSGASVAVSRNLSNGNQTLTLVPSVPLQGSTLYTLTIAGVADLSGQTMTAVRRTMLTTTRSATPNSPGYSIAWRASAGSTE